MAGSDRDSAYREASTSYADADLQEHGSRCIRGQRDRTNWAELPPSANGVWGGLTEKIAVDLHGILPYLYTQKRIPPCRPPPAPPSRRVN